MLPNNSNVLLAAEQAAKLTEKRVRVIGTESIPAGLAAMVAFDPSRNAETNVADMEEVLASVATGAVTIASKDAQLNGLRIILIDFFPDAVHERWQKNLFGVVLFLTLAAGIPGGYVILRPFIEGHF